MRRSSNTSTPSSSYTIKSKSSIVLNVSFRGNKDSEAVETMIKKYLYKSHGKFRLCLIDIDQNGPVTGRMLSVSLTYVDPLDI